MIIFDAMNVIDIILGILLLLGFIRGFQKGFKGFAKGQTGFKNFARMQAQMNFSQISGLKQKICMIQI